MRIRHQCRTDGRRNTTGISHLMMRAFVDIRSPRAVVDRFEFRRRIRFGEFSSKSIQNGISEKQLRILSHESQPILNRTSVKVGRLTEQLNRPNRLIYCMPRYPELFQLSRVHN